MVHPRLAPSGGGQAVAAWALQALRGHSKVSLLTLDPVDFPALNSNFGTTLRACDFELIAARGLSQRLIESVPSPPLARLENALLARAAQRLSSTGHFDRFLCTNNEIDFGRKGVQYVHFPYAYLKRPLQDYRWYHRLPGALALYLSLTDHLSGVSLERLRENRALVNSGFIAGLYQEAHGVEADVVPPPVPGDFPETPWDARRNVVVGVGRMHPCKRWHEAIEVVRRVRAEGLEVGLLILGSKDTPEYLHELQVRAAREPWCEVSVDLTRAELVRRVAECRYGIHLMVEEHFGIAPAELQRAGCLTFVHNSGGPVEIVDGDAEVLFDNDAEAAEKIARMILDDTARAAALSRLRVRAERYSEHAFMERIRQEVLE